MPDLPPVPPAFIYLLGALLVPFLRGRARQVVALAIPLIAFFNYFLIKDGVTYWTIPGFLDFEFVLGRADKWSLIFLNIFTVLSFCGILYIIKDNKALDLSAGLLYSGCAMGVVMAGDLITLYMFWEMLTLGAVLCLLTRRAKAGRNAAYRYILVHVFGGVILLAGLVLHIAGGGSIAFGGGKENVIGLSGLASWLIFIGFGVNCAWPVLGSWLTDTYPEASYGGVIFMATFTTKTAIYVLSQTFAGEEALIWIGAAMATIPLFFAVVENDLRKVLAYCLVNQVGFMTVGVGLGKLDSSILYESQALNGTAAHAYCHILYKALLFMSIGSVIYRTGKSKATELGGLYKYMPWTCLFCCIGAVSISFPFFCGFVSKSMIMSTAAAENHFIVWLALVFGSAGVFHLAGIKVPFFAFFSRDSGLRPKEAPSNQLWAMGIIAGLCIFVGTFPNAFLYPMLPEVVDKMYKPYTWAHVTDLLALLLSSALAFTLLLRAGFYPAAMRSTNVDFDCLYRKSGKGMYFAFDKLFNGANQFCKTLFFDKIAGALSSFFVAAPSTLLSWFAVPVWKIQGKSDDEIDCLKENLFAVGRAGAFPIGLTALLGVLLLALLSVIFVLK